MDKIGVGLIRSRSMKALRILQTVGIASTISTCFLVSALSKPTDKIKGRIHFVAKGEVSLTLGDEVLGYSDSSRGDKYINGQTRPHKFKSGDIVFLKMRSSAVHRDLSLAIESKDGSRTIPIRSADFRYLGADVALSEVSPEAIAALEAPEQAESTDPKMDEMWRAHGIPEFVLDECEWIKLPSKDQWHAFALTITPEMLRRNAE